MKNLVLAGTLALATALGANTARADGVTDTEVKVGTFLGLSGDFALPARDVNLAVESYFAKVNEAGGVNGRKLVFIAIDDGYVPARSAATIRRLVTQEDVFAVHQPFGTPNALAAMPFAQERGVPMIGVHGYSRKLFKPAQPMVYGNWTPFDTQISIMGEYFFEKGEVAQIGIIHHNTEAGLEGLVGAEQVAKAHEQELVAAAVTPGSPDFRPALLNLRDKGVTHLLMVLGPQDSAKVIVQAREAGFNPEFGGHQGTPDPLTTQLAGTAVEGVYGIATSALPSWDPAGWPGVKEYSDALAAHAPDAKPSAFGIRAFADAKIFVEALRRAGDRPTRESLIAALEGLSGFETGIYPPVTYSAERHDGNRGAVIVQSQGGLWVPVGEWQQSE